MLLNILKIVFHLCNGDEKKKRICRQFLFKIILHSYIYRQIFHYYFHFGFLDPLIQSNGIYV